MKLLKFIVPVKSDYSRRERLSTAYGLLYASIFSLIIWAVIVIIFLIY